MKFPSIGAAQEYSRKHYLHMCVEIEGAHGVLEVYPGGRTIWWDASLGKAYERRRLRLRLTPEQGQG